MNARAPRGVTLLSLGWLAGLLTFWKWRPRIQDRSVPKHFAVWERVLPSRQGALPAAVLMGRIRAHHRALYAERPRFASRVLQRHLEDNILPGLAAYRALQEESPDAETARLAVEQLLTESVMAGPYRSYRLFFRLPFAFAVLKWMMPRVMARHFPASGWGIRWSATSPGRVAFDIHRCFYLDVLRHYGAQALTQAFCHGDDVLFSALPPHIAWERRQTLGRGGAICDFCWRDWHVTANDPISINGDRPAPARSGQQLPGVMP